MKFFYYSITANLRLLDDENQVHHGNAREPILIERVTQLNFAHITCHNDRHLFGQIADSLKRIQSVRIHYPHGFMFLMAAPYGRVTGKQQQLFLSRLTVHELSLAENVLQIIEDAMQNQKFFRIKKVWLEIGLLACVQQESLRFYFEIVTRDTAAHEARLEIIEVAGQGWCDQCACEMPLTTRYDACLHCGHYGLKIIRGEEMRVKELEVE